MSRYQKCICCHERGHLIAQCPQFHADLMKPSAGTCARCGGPGNFMPYKLPSVGRRAPSVEAIFVCACCSLPGCTHSPDLTTADLSAPFLAQER